MGKKHIVVIGSRFPYPLEKGDKLRLYYQIKSLSKTYEVHLISLTEKAIGQEHIEAVQKYCSSVSIYKIPFWKRLINVILAFLSGQSIQLAYFYNASVAAKIKSKINEINPSVIFCQLIRASEYVKNLEGFKILDYMDTFSLGMKRRAEESNFILKHVFNKESRLISNYESLIYKHFDKTCIISAQDREKINVDRQQDIVVLPNGVDIDFFKPREKTAKYQIGFIGNLGYFPNKMAVEYLLTNIQSKGNFTMLIAGARAEAKLLNLNNPKIKVTGWVDDIRDAYADVEIFVAPLFSGIGQQNKILEAMAMGIPCITTDMVNRAILAKEEEEILIANTPEEFIKQINRLLKDQNLARLISEKARQFVINKYDWLKFDEKMNQLLDNNINKK